ncbi:NAD(P)/FAD-dependent oxidoreductase [Palleronia sp. LCG004]|uniref:NAD(P)/FAD-dependent oxidoreductase n=1 Tax=Palleronia sp. LCG004 TaxID=3079304 RepID=UPI002943F586|nr:NAD(P)/FAD-dependent oxidoreductase [Palleronia sp. LCG004]WOI57378.1 NAD(P)/FAD-dependent oxidoreductase [Palleronia sp. LCG004]
MSERKTQIVIVGGGAAGLALARKLGNRYGRSRHDIILIDRNRSHIWKPLLHEVASGSLDPNLEDVGYGGHAAIWGYRYFNGSLEKIDRERRTVTTAPLKDEDGAVIVDRHELRYDYLVLAMGGVSNDFGIEGVREHAMFLEDRKQADRFRQVLLNACLQLNAKRRDDPGARLSICIVGGGATGVELSAELVNCARSLRDYGLEVFDHDALKIHLLEAGPRLLPALDEKVARNVRGELEGLGIDVRTDAMVERVESGRLHVKDGGIIDARMILWATGVRGDNSVERMSDLELTKLDLFVTRPTLQTTLDDRIFAIGDCASCHLPGMDRPVPPRAQSAGQMADCVFDNLDRLQKGKEARDFVYRDRGALVSLSRFATVGNINTGPSGGKLALEGRIARAAYMSLYRLHLLAIHGWLRGSVQIVAAKINKVVRPTVKLH